MRIFSFGVQYKPPHFVSIQRGKGGGAMISDERMQKAAEELLEVMLDSLPDPDECNVEFSEDFKKKMQAMISGIPCAEKGEGG